MDSDDMLDLDPLLADPKTLEDLEKVGAPAEFLDLGGQQIATGHVRMANLLQGTFVPSGPDLLNPAGTHEGVLKMGTVSLRVRLERWVMVETPDWVIRVLQ